MLSLPTVYLELLSFYVAYVDFNEELCLECSKYSAALATCSACSSDGTKVTCTACTTGSL